MALDPKQSLGVNYLLNEGDRTKFAELWKENYRRYGQPKRVGEEQEYQAPEMYVAKTPVEGIPAIIGSLPGYKQCLVFQSFGDGDEKELELVEGFELDVYNVSDSDITGDTWIQVVRDKYGTWYALVSGGTSEFWAELVGKTLKTPPHYIEYYAVRINPVDHAIPVYWEEVVDSQGDGPDPGGDLGLSGTGTGTGTGTAPGTNTFADILLCYEVNNTDLPYVPARSMLSGTGTAFDGDGSENYPYPPGSPFGYQRMVVRLTPAAVDELTSGSGTAVVPYYLFQMQPRWGMVEVTGEADVGTGLFPGVLLAYDQDVGDFVSHETVWVHDANAPIP